jgi:hypothetical protein
MHCMRRRICCGQRLDSVFVEGEPTRHATFISVEEAVDVRREVLHSASSLGEELECGHGEDPGARHFPYGRIFP